MGLNKKNETAPGPSFGQLKDDILAQSEKADNLIAKFGSMINDMIDQETKPDPKIKDTKRAAVEAIMELESTALVFKERFDLLKSDNNFISDPNNKATLDALDKLNAIACGFIDKFNLTMQDLLATYKEYAQDSTNKPHKAGY